MRNEVLRRYREQVRCESRTEFAQAIVAAAMELGENVGCDASVIRRWEAGQHSCPRPVYQRILRHLTGFTPQELGFLPARAGGGQAGGRDVTASTVVAAARRWMVGSHDPDRPPEGDRSREERVGDARVSALMDRVRRLRRMDDESGGATVVDWTMHELAWAEELTRRCDPRRHSEWAGLHAATGELAHLAGWLTFDQGHHHEARRLWTRGLDAARLARDNMLGAAILSCLSYQALWVGRPGEALSFITLARHGSSGSPAGRLQALLATREARIRARLGDGPGCEAALGQAREFFDRARLDTEPDWVSWVTSGVLAADAGRARLDLGSARDAERDLLTGLARYGSTQPRNRALHLTSVAEARLRRGDVEGASEAAEAAQDLREDRSSQRVRDRLVWLGRAFDRVPSPAARVAADRIRTALAA